LVNGYGLSAIDVVNAINAQNIVLPSGTAKIGDREYSVQINSSSDTVEELNSISTWSTAPTAAVP